MTRKITHLFDTQEEADAFEDGVEWVNDSAIKFVERFAAPRLHPDTYGIVYEDEDGDEDDIINHQK